MSVTAIVVASGDRYLRRTLEALAVQERAPERVIVVDASPAGAGLSADLSTKFGGDIVSAHGAKNFGQAIARVLTGALAGNVDTEWLWLLHCDSAPEPAALAELLRATADSHKVGIAGCKQLDDEFRDRLISVGVAYTRGGRRLAEIEPGEIDQGQYDHREDVGGVGTAGMLIRTRVWREVGGIDPVLGPFGDGQDLSRRVRLAGHRVIVVPGAKVRHARASLRAAGARASFFARRLSILHLRLTTTAPWRLLFTILAMVLIAPVRALWRVATNDVALAAAELRAPLVAIGRVRAVVRSRRRYRSTAQVSRSAAAALYARPGKVWALWWHRHRQSITERRTRRAPNQLILVEHRRLARARRLTLAAVIVVAVAATAVFIAPGALGAGMPPLFGGGILGLDESIPDLWRRAGSAWLATGDGYPGPGDPFAFVLAALATVVAGPIGASAGVVGANAAINVLLVLALPLAALAGWFGAGAFTRSLPARAWAALAWTCGPTFILSLTDGRIGFVLAHVLLPFAALALARTTGADRRDQIDLAGGNRPVVRTVASGTGSLGAAGAAGLLLAVIVASAPILAPAVVLILLAGSLRGHARLLFAGLPVLVLFAPMIGAAIATGDWAGLLAAPGGSGIAPGSEPALNAGTGAIALSGLFSAANLTWLLGAVALLVAAAALLRGRGSAALTIRLGWCIIGLGVLTAVGAHYLVTGFGYDGVGSFGSTVESSAPGLSLAAFGLIVAVTAGLAGARDWLTTRGLGWRHGVVAAAILALGVSLGATGWQAWTHLEDGPTWQARGADPVSALAREVAAGEDRGRVLAIAPTDEAILAELWRGNGPQFFDTPTVIGARALHRVDVTDAADTELTTLVAALATGDAGGAWPGLAAHAITTVVVPALDSRVLEVEGEIARSELVAALDGIVGLERITENASGTIWRVQDTSARVTIHRGDRGGGGAGGEVEHIPSGLIGVDATVTGGGTIYLAERADPRWRASLDGRPLRAVSTDWRQGFELPEGSSGNLKIDFQPTGHAAWKITLAVVVGFAAVLAIPTRPRRPQDLA